MTKTTGLGIASIRHLIESKQVTAVQVAKEHLDHASSQDDKTGAFICLTEKLALTQAEDVDNLVAKGESLPPLAGVPLALKDNICVQGYPTTCASKILGNFISPFNATAAERLFTAGALCIGKTNLDEFAMGSSTENSAFGPTKNPWDTEKVPGGSSGGSAVAVASGYAAFALGSDTGGSVRQPAAFTGIVGMKPTYGLVSRFGLVAFASSLDQIGPLCSNVEDTALSLAIIQGHDAKDSTSLPEPYLSTALNPRGFSPVDLDWAGNLAKNSPERICAGARIGVIEELLGPGTQPAVIELIQEGISKLESLGAKIINISLPHLKYSVAVYYIIAAAEASANLARYDGARYGARVAEASNLLDMYLSSRKEGFGNEVKRRIMLGTYALSTGYYDAYYKKAQQVRRLLKEDFDQAFENCDWLLSPTAPTVAYGIGEMIDDPLTMYLGDIATIPANLAGLPGISIPCGTVESNPSSISKNQSFPSSALPVGLQLTGPQLSDRSLIELAWALEQALGHMNDKSPALSLLSK